MVLQFRLVSQSDQTTRLVTEGALKPEFLKVLLSYNDGIKVLQSFHTPVISSLAFR